MPSGMLLACTSIKTQGKKERPKNAPTALPVCGMPKHLCCAADAECWSGLSRTQDA